MEALRVNKWVKLVAVLGCTFYGNLNYKKTGATESDKNEKNTWLVLGRFLKIRTRFWGFGTMPQIFSTFFLNLFFQGTRQGSALLMFGPIRFVNVNVNKGKKFGAWYLAPQKTRQPPEKTPTAHLAKLLS